MDRDQVGDGCLALWGVVFCAALLALAVLTLAPSGTVEWWIFRIREWWK